MIPVEEFSEWLDAALSNAIPENLSEYTKQQLHDRLYQKLFDAAGEQGLLTNDEI